MMVRSSLRPATASEPPPSGGGGGWGTPVMLGTLGLELGDSQTDGRAAVGTTHSDWEARMAIYNATYPANAISLSNIYRKGVSGSGWSLQQNIDHYLNRAERFTRTYNRWQESGNRNQAGQATPTEFGNTWETCRGAVHTASPSAIFIYQTAFGFFRTEPERIWDESNDELRARKAIRDAMGQFTYLSEVDRNVKAVIAAKGNDQAAKDAVFYPSGHLNYAHYTEFGNFIVGMSDLEALEHNPEDLDLSPITAVSAEDKQLVVNVILDLH